MSWFKKFRHNRWTKAASKLNLVHVFTQEGSRYYRFPKETNMPLDRFSMSMALMERLSSGLSGNEMSMILDSFDKALAAGVSNPKNASVIATLVNIIRERQDTVIHKDLLINIAATWIIREDEDPYTINADIHNEKIKTFESMCNGGAHDFFTRLGIEPLIPLMTMSANDFQTLWDYNVVQQRQLVKALTHLDSVLTTERPKRERVLKVS